MAEDPPHSTRVIVIGAGLAGLSAATLLAERGHEVTILEAKMRPGGRVATLRSPFSDGLYAEMGGMFFADVHDLTLRYARQHGLTLIPVVARDLATFFYVRGQRITLRSDASITWPVELTAAERRLGIFGMARRYTSAAVQQVRDAIEGGWAPDSTPPAEIGVYDDLSFADLLRERGASPGAISLLRLGYLDQWGDGIDSVSALYHLRDKALLHGARAWYSIKGGNDQLPAAMAAQFRGRIVYGAAAKRVEQTTGSVRVVFNHGGRLDSLTADHAVLAIPFSVLRGMEVSPPLSPPKQRAIAQLSHTSIARVYLQYRSRPWGPATPLAWGATDLPIMSVREPTYTQTGNRGILEAVVSGPHARGITDMTEQARIDFTRTHMEAVFPEARGEYERGFSKCWDSDPWARGDYAWYKPGEMKSLGPHIATPEGRIHFGGDHTSDRPGWMQGAIASGHRVAREIDGLS